MLVSSIIVEKLFLVKRTTLSRRDRMGKGVETLEGATLS